MACLVIPGAWHPVTARGIKRHPIFRDNRDRGYFLVFSLNYLPASGRKTARPTLD